MVIKSPLTGQLEATHHWHIRIRINANYILPQIMSFTNLKTQKTWGGSIARPLLLQKSSHAFFATAPGQSFVSTAGHVLRLHFGMAASTTIRP